MNDDDEITVPCGHFVFALSADPSNSYLSDRKNRHFGVTPYYYWGQQLQALNPEH